MKCLNHSTVNPSWNIPHSPETLVWSWAWVSACVESLMFSSVHVEFLWVLQLPPSPKNMYLEWKQLLVDSTFMNLFSPDLWLNLWSSDRLINIAGVSIHILLSKTVFFKQLSITILNILPYHLASFWLQWLFVPHAEKMKNISLITSLFGGLMFVWSFWENSKQQEWKPKTQEAK